MTKDEFLKRFSLHSLSTEVSLGDFNFKHQLTPAAVLIPLIEEQQQLYVVLTKRASHLKHHAGQVSFPGGKVDQQDANIIDTALRETFEEIGVAKEAIEIVGSLRPYPTITGYEVTPIVGFVNSPQQYIIDSNEVAEIFHVPLQHFLRQEQHITIDIYRDNNTFPVHFMPYKGYNIWGATAAILKDLSTLVG